MAAVLPYPNMDFVPLDTLTATELDHMVANIEYLKTYCNTQDSTISTLNTKVTNLQNTVNTINGAYTKLTVSTTDIGTGATLAANTIYAVVS